MTFDPRTEANLTTLTPATAEKARAFLAAVIASNRLPRDWSVKIIEGFRSYAEQNADYAKGRTAPGPVVTHAPAGYSFHNFGVAFDIGIFDGQGHYIDDVLKKADDIDAAYKELGPIGAAVGLEWGGKWTGVFQDYPHYQMPDLCLSTLRAQHDQGARS